MKIITHTTIFLLFFGSYSYCQTTNYGIGSGTIGVGCSFFGINAGQNNTGTYNTFIGDNSGFGSVKNSGRDNIFLGAYTGYHNFGNKNVFIGNISGYSNTTGSENTFTGVESGFGNTTGYSNCFYGTSSGQNNLTGFENVFMGHSSGKNFTNGSGNTFIGHEAGQNSNFTGANVFIGYKSGENASGSNCNFIGTSSGRVNQALGNVFIGDATGLNNINGGNNVFIGYNTAVSNVNGYQNTYIGAANTVSFVSINNATAIGFGANATASNSVVLGNPLVTSIGGFVATFSNLSDKRYKTSIKNSKNDLRFILALEPKNYNYDLVKIMKEHNDLENSANKSHMNKEQLEEVKARQERDMFTAEEHSQKVETGLLAQDVEKAMKETGYTNFSGLITPEINGGRYALGYGAFTVPLIGAVKELKKEKDDEIAELKEKNLELEQRLVALEKLIINQDEANTNVKRVTLVNEEAKINQNIPNPFTETSTISYFIPQSATNATLKIVNINGTMVRNISISEFGNGKIELSVKNFKSGTYSYSLIVHDKIVETRKMVITN